MHETPPLAGFFGKFLLLKSVLEKGAADPLYYWLAGVACFGVVVSIYYYFGVIRAVYWSKDPPELSPIAVPLALRIPIYVCMAGLLYLVLTWLITRVFQRMERRWLAHLQP